ncbi:BZ3500_MvSof-1268-A1-R1_Chr5-2g07942 [Microbotryum saponariae]|uniref:N-acetylglucosaminylphosphatidylinositol deacetylase n=1 Tax=Microbotryum saponariae TaxID=289078 RepID=A0A2X0LFW0_9BASI|nr:BZ3500_MvSof-1268-A1-R1_Chr5-2g07942 [Microbotryum saponariae]SDA05811.1 BZ3501_MvSof-1269-A2-R1_Chr5-2g07764 [Microbotryum saponariae]
MMRLALGPARLMPRQRSSGALPGLLRLAVVLLFTCYQLSAVSATVFSCVGGTVYVVAHPDDDLLFQSPDLWTDVVSGACITTIFLTSGDSGVGLTYAKARESGNEAANSYMANVDDSWTEFVATFGGQPVLVRTLVGAPQVQRVWFRLPDGNVDGTGYAPNGYQSLRGLYFGSISSISSVDGGATFTLATLKNAISDILTARQAKNVRTLDHLSDYDAGDHSDHITTARITSALVGNTAPSANFAGYMGYPINNFAPTLISGSAQFVAKSNAFFQYTPFDSGECQSYSACTSAGRGESYWLARQYVVTSALAQQSYTGSAESPVTIPNGTNIARIANATASSYAGPTQVPGRAIDGIISGYPGNSSAEWVSDGGTAGTTFSLTWNDTYSVTSIVLYDRPNVNDWAKGGTITFADGKSVSFGALANDGSATLVTLSQTVITNSLVVKFTSVSAATGSVGLAEIQVFGDLCSGCQDTGGAIENATTISATAFSDLALLAQATASSEANGQSADRVNDGVISGYPANWTAEWSTKGQGAGAWLNLTWPQSIWLDSLVFYDRPNLGDWITGGTLAFDDGSTVTIPSLNNDGSATVVNLTNAVTTTSLLFTVTSAGPSSGSVGLAELAVFYSQGQVGGVPTGSNTTSNTTSGTTTTTTGAFADLALTASASASSGASGQTADRANDGVISGYPSNWTAEWATQGEGTGAWLNLTWSSHYMVDSLVFYDRPNPDDWITGGTVAFSDGTTVTIPSLNDDGSATVVNLTAAVNTTTLLFTVTSAGPSSSSVGLAELGVFYSQAQSSSGTTAVSATVGSSDAYSDLALTASASASSGARGQTADRANDGVISGYPSNWTAEWATQGEGTGAWLSLTWSSHYMVDSLVFYDRPNPDDWITGGTVAFSDGTTVTIPSLNDDGSATVVNLTAAVNTTTLLFTVTSAGPSSSSVGLAELGVFYSQAQSSSGTTAVNTTLTSTTTTSSGTVGSSDAYSDLALTASASASSGASGQTTDRANDGVISGYPSNWTAEWATQGEGTGAWLNLTWSSHYMVDSLVFYDRPNTEDWITGGTVAFSDGTTVTIPSLNDDGSATVVNLTTAVKSSSLLFTVTSVGPSTGSAGLAELGVFYSKSQTPDLVMNNTTYVQSNNTATTSNSTSAIISLTTDTSVDLALNATATASSSASGQEPDKANDGKVSGYKEDGSGIWQQEWATEDQTVGAWLTLTWPSNVEINEVVLYDRPNLADHVTAGTLTFSSGAVVSFGALANNGSATSVALAQPIIASVLTLTVTGASPSSSNIGLAEIMVYGAVPVNTSANSTGSANSTLTNSTVETSSALGAVN